MEYIFDSLSKGRVLMLKLIDGLSIEQLNKIPYSQWSQYNVK